jgi:capsular exopolysaccharide synthesis family protein
MVERRAEAQDEPGAPLGRYLHGIRRRWRLMLLVLAAVVVATLVFSGLQTRLYQGQAKVLLNPEMFAGASGFQFDAALATQTEIELVKSEPVQAIVAQQFPGVGEASADRVGQTLLIGIKYRNTSARRAAAIANAYAQAYVDFRNRSSSTPAASPSTANVGPRLVSMATAPGSPVQPRPLRNLLVVIPLGLLLGVGLASLLEALDDSVKSRSDLQRASGLPVLGVIPEAPEWETVPSLAEDTAPPAAEAFRSLRTSLQMLSVDKPARTVQITSAGSGEGKTTIVANLGVALAGMAQRVALVDADLRRPALHAIFGVSNEHGVSSVLAGEVPLEAALQPVHDTMGLVLLGSGPEPPNPAELLASRKMAELMFRLRTDFDVVIVDTPPVLAFTDAMVVTTWAEAVVVVACFGRTRRRQLQSALDLLRQGDAPLAGTVLNRVGLGEEDAIDYGSYYHRDGTRRERPRVPTPPSVGGPDPKLP